MFKFVYRALYKLGKRGLSLYEKYLLNEVKSKSMPRHIGIILDGNRRYAKKVGLNPWDGHEKGAEKLTEFLKWCLELNIKNVTVFAFSTHNLKRDPEEVDKLMKLFKKKFEELATHEEIHKNKVRVRVWGRKEILPLEVREAIEKAEKETCKYGKLNLNVCIGYDGRQEMVDAIKKISRRVLNSEIKLENINEKLVAEHLYSKDLPDPDLIIRTSGEERLSGFLLWQSAYSELYFCDTYWPEYRKVDFLRAIRSYQTRERRFGR